MVSMSCWSQEKPLLPSKVVLPTSHPSLCLIIEFGGWTKTGFECSGFYFVSIWCTFTLCMCVLAVWIILSLNLIISSFLFSPSLINMLSIFCMDLNSGFSMKLVVSVSFSCLLLFFFLTYCVFPLNILSELSLKANAIRME